MMEGGLEELTEEGTGADVVQQQQHTRNDLKEHRKG
jgi:hypothetical protein